MKHWFNLRLFWEKCFSIKIRKCEREINKGAFQVLPSVLTRVNIWFRSNEIFVSFISVRVSSVSLSSNIRLNLQLSASAETARNARFIYPDAPWSKLNWKRGRAWMPVTDTTWYRYRASAFTSRVSGYMG